MKELKNIKHINIISAGPYGWNCYGKNQTLYDIVVSSKYINDDYPFEDLNIGSFVMNNKGEVAEITFFKANKQNELKAWRWMDSKFLDAYVKEANQRGINPKSFMDDVEYKDISKEKILYMIERLSNKVHTELKNNKRKAEENHEDVEILLDESDFSFLAKKAHEQNITFNELVNNILREELKKVESNPLINKNNKVEKTKNSKKFA